MIKLKMQFKEIPDSGGMMENFVIVSDTKATREEEKFLSEIQYAVEELLRMRAKETGYACATERYEAILVAPQPASNN